MLAPAPGRAVRGMDIGRAALGSGRAQRVGPGSWPGRPGGRPTRRPRGATDEPTRRPGAPPMKGPCVGGAGSKRRWWRVTPSVGAGVSAHLGPGGAARQDSTTSTSVASSRMPTFDHRDDQPIERAELISVGTELLLGEIVDTNSAYLAQYLAGRGVDVLWSARVGDNQGRIAHLIAQGLSRSDLVVLGGGLVPPTTTSPATPWRPSWV